MQKKTEEERTHIARKKALMAEFVASSTHTRQECEFFNNKSNALVPYPQCHDNEHHKPCQTNRTQKSLASHSAHRAEWLRITEYLRLLHADSI
jgi:hypothetical protein